MGVAMTPFESEDRGSSHSLEPIRSVRSRRRCRRCAEVDAWGRRLPEMWDGMKTGGGSEGVQIRVFGRGEGMGMSVRGMA